jgi:hypothetical protein
MTILTGLTTQTKSPEAFNAIRAFFASEVQLVFWTSARIICRHGNAASAIPKRDGTVPAAVRAVHKHGPTAANSVRSEST